MTIYPDERLAIYQRDSYKCWLCGITVSPDNNAPRNTRATLDHIIHQCTNGTHDASNLLTCCYRCNELRSDSKIAFNEEYRQIMYSKNKYWQTKRKRQTLYLRCLVALREWQRISIIAFGHLSLFVDATKNWENDVSNLDNHTLKTRIRFLLDAISEIHNIFIHYYNNSDPRKFIHVA